ncbi:helix-turn-helix domain-containing protein [Saccharibacillus sp. JS10]|uniref:helix-turn-helix transcriptional regulator n=1 Tax=Saccharibacillus sp. JS10 TaxID=2950552 RepID=UPI00210E6FA4|nr:helix-turn-helix domain-containing protein [Saccharibacillus sp. JS10]MCQ4087842.1 AraC family transcriptional regulator [Saccharibacillus sp. JS10]
MKKRNSVWTRLAVSYLSIVLVIVLSLCSVFYIYSSQRHLSELENRNQMTLTNVARTINSEVFQRVQQVVLGLTLDRTSDLSLFQQTTWTEEPTQILEWQQLLKSKVAAQPDLIEAIHLYDPRSGMMLSSSYGLIDREDRERSSNQSIDWIEEMSTLQASGMWTKSREIPTDLFSKLPGGDEQKLLTYAHSYPFQASGADSQLIVAVDVKETAIEAIIHNMMPFQYRETWMMQDSGTLAMMPQALSAMQPYIEWSRSAHEDHPTSKGDYTLFHETLPTTGWTLYSATPHSFFQEQSSVIQRLVLIVSVVAMLIGLLLSGVMTKLIYSPLKKVVATINKLNGHPISDSNEYGIIDTALQHLNNKIYTLEEHLRATEPLVQRNLILKLLQGYSAELSEKEQIWIKQLFHEAVGLRYMLLHVSHISKNHEHPVDTDFDHARLLSRLERVITTNLRVIAEKLSNGTIAAIIVRHSGSTPATEHLDDGYTDVHHAEMAELASSFQQTCSDIPGVTIQMAWGCEVREPALLHRSRSEAESRLTYAYFLPEKFALQDFPWAEREDSLEEIPQAVLSKFRDKLPGRQLNEIIESVDDIIEATKNGRYPADYCHFILSNTVFAFSDYLKSIRYKQPSGGHPDLHRQYIVLPHINAFRSWLLSTLTIFLSETEKRNSDRSTDTLESAKQYIDTHLADDLSLEAVSSQVFISAKYLSRLFKEELGITYTEYVTKQRIHTAKILLEKGGATIEQISTAVGYTTTAYFIKKFKEAHGCTPGQYLRESRKQTKSLQQGGAS